MTNSCENIKAFAYQAAEPPSKRRRRAAGDQGASTRELFGYLLAHDFSFAFRWALTVWTIRRQLQLNSANAANTAFLAQRCFSGITEFSDNGAGCLRLRGKDRVRRTATLPVLRGDFAGASLPAVEIRFRRRGFRQPGAARASLRGLGPPSHRVTSTGVRS